MISFREIIESDAERILRWRTSSRITNMMTTDIEFNINKQLEWIKISRKRHDYYHWIIQYNQTDIGFISILALDNLGTMSVGFYIGDPKQSHIAIKILILTYSYIFRALKAIKIENFIHEKNHFYKIEEFLGAKRNLYKDFIKIKNGEKNKFFAYSLDRNDFSRYMYNSVDLIFPFSYREYNRNFMIKKD